MISKLRENKGSLKNYPGTILCTGVGTFEPGILITEMGVVFYR